MLTRSLIETPKAGALLIVIKTNNINNHTCKFKREYD